MLAGCDSPPVTSAVDGLGNERHVSTRMNPHNLRRELRTACESYERPPRNCKAAFPFRPARNIVSIAGLQIRTCSSPLVRKIPAAARTLYAAHPAAVRGCPRVAKTTRGLCCELHTACGNSGRSSPKFTTRSPFPTDTRNVFKRQPANLDLLFVVFVQKYYARSVHR